MRSWQTPPLVPQKNRRPMDVPGSEALRSSQTPPLVPPQKDRRPMDVPGVVSSRHVVARCSRAMLLTRQPSAGDTVTDRAPKVP